MKNQSIAHVHAGLAGHYILETHGPDGQLRNRIEFDNVITDNGLDLIYTCPTAAYGFRYYLNNCCVGLGNTTPSTTDTSLANWLATAGVYDAGMTRTYVAGPPAYWKGIQKYTFGTGVAAGNLTEIGTFATNGRKDLLFSRALIVDGLGAPTTLVVDVDEILTVTYELRVYINLDDVAGTFVSNGVTYNTVLRSADIDDVPQLGKGIARSSDGSMISIAAYAGALGTVTNFPGTPSYDSGYYNGASDGPYTSGSYQIDTTTVFPVGAANWANGIQAFYVYSPLHKFQMSFIDPLTSKGIPKVVGEQMSVTFRLSWGRYVP